MAANQKPPRLLQQAEKIVLQPIHPHLISYCPTMDLIATVTTEENLEVYRINGQKAFGVKRKNEDVTVDIVQWEFSGKKVCIGWSDSSVEVVSTETGKRLRLEEGVGRQKNKNKVGADEDENRLTCVGWGLNFIDVESVKQRLGMRKHGANFENEDAEGSTGDRQTTELWDAFKDDTTIEDFLARQPDLQALDVSPDLPDQLAMMDIEALLPRLPLIPLPPASPFMRFGQQQDAGAFGTQAEVDSLLHSSHLKENNSVDMFVRCTRKGTVHPSMYDSAEAVDVHLPSSWNIQNSTPLLHASHPYSCSHGLLTELKVSGKTKLAFVPLTLNFISSAGIYLHLIASKTSQLQSLLLYVQQCLQRIRTYWKHSRDLPGKFMMNVSETLEEKGQGSLVQGLYHLACTGNCPPLIKEWLVDELQEAGHKRWDSTVSTSLSTLLQILHENLLPAIDRCTIIISRLRGLAAYHDSGWIFNTPITDFSNLLETIKNLRLLASTALLYANDEKRFFLSFSKWLRYEIDYEATEPDSQSRAEMDVRDPGVDIGVVLEYIRQGLVKSDLAPYLRAEDELAEEKQGKASLSYQDTKKAIDLLKEEASYKEEALCLDHVLRHFKDGCTKLFQQISVWQESEIRMDCGIVLEEGETGQTKDMRMIVDPTQHHTNISTYIALASPTTPSILNIHKLFHTPSVTQLPKDIHSYAFSTLRFQDAIVLDAKFVDDLNMLVLLQLEDLDKTCLILNLPYRPSSSSTTTKKPDIVSYQEVDKSSFATTFLPTGSPVPSSSRNNLVISSETIQKHTKHVFEGRFTPLKLVVNGRKGRRVVVVLGSDRKHYRVLDLDFREGRAKNRHAREGGGAEFREARGEAMEISSNVSVDDLDVDMVGA